MQVTWAVYKLTDYVTTNLSIVPTLRQETLV